MGPLTNSLRLARRPKFARYLARFTTPRKVANFIANRMEQHTARAILTSRPYLFAIETGMFCNLRCTGCPVGIRHPEMNSQRFLDLETFKSVMAQIKDYAFSVTLHHWGEPLLNPQIAEMIAHCSSVGCGSVLHSNLNHLPDDLAVNLIRSGLTHLYASIDGGTQQTYEHYRVGGDLENVVANIRKLLSIRRELKSRFPLITWKYLQFPHTTDDLAQARRWAAELGVDEFLVVRGNINHLEYGSDLLGLLNPSGKPRRDPDRCPFLWNLMVVHSDGSVLPCCFAYRAQDSFGNIINNGLDRVWNNDRFVEARRVFTEGQPPIHPPCSNCAFEQEIRRRRSDR